MTLYALVLLLLFRLRPPAVGPVVGLTLALGLVTLAWVTGIAEATRPHVDRWIAHDPGWDRQCHTLDALTFVPIATLVPLAALWITRGRTKALFDQGVVLGISTVLGFFAAMVATLFVVIQHLACDSL